MRNIFILLFVCVAHSAHSQQDEFESQFHQIVESEKRANASKINSTLLSTISDYDIIYHRCEWQVDPSVNYISGKITTHFKPFTTGFDTLLFNLSDSLVVDSVLFHGASMSINHSGNTLTSALSSVVPVNTLDSISVYYQGIPASTGFGSFVQSTHNGAPIIWTLSEPYGASDWWPCKNGLTDKADSVDIIVTTPSANRAASNGLLVSEIVSGLNKIYHWKHRYPIATYLICFAVTNYVQYTHNVPFGTSNTTVLNYVYPEDSANAASQTPDIIAIMQLYDTLFGVYPFVNEKYGHAQIGWGGAMEHQTFTFMGGWSFELQAHELAHHWFGNKVTCGSWEDIWLNEGIASYLPGLAWMPFKSGRISNITSQSGGSVWCNDTNDVNRIFDGRLSYAKGAMILHQLRWIIGDSAFFAAINNYLSDTNLAYGFARTSDLKSHFEISSGQNLTWYFNDWFTGEGFPSFQIAWNQTGSTVNLTVNQTQSHVSVPFFELPLPVQFKNQTQDTIIRLSNIFSGETFSVNIPFQADSVKLDPDLWLITANNTVTSVNENDLSQLISVYPNPASSLINISLPSISGTSSSIRLYDVYGRECYSLVTKQTSLIFFETDKLNNGIYFLTINTQNYTATKKIIINH